MPALDQTEAGRVLASQLKAAAYTAPSAVYVVLGTSQPSASGFTTEVTGGGYARQAVTFGTVSAGAVSSSSAATFTNMPGPTTVSAVELHGNGTTGNTTARLYWQGATQSFAAKSCAAGDTLTFASGAISVALT